MWTAKRRIGQVAAFGWWTVSPRSYIALTRPTPSVMTRTLYKSISNIQKSRFSLWWSVALAARLNLRGRKIALAA
jgi:hypothetical protein